MNRRLKILIILIYSLILVGLATRQRSLIAFAIPFVIYLAAGFFLEPHELRLQVKRELSSNRVIQGSPVSIHLNIKNLSAPIKNLVIADIIPSELEVLDGNAKILTSLNSGESVTLAYTLLGDRGIFHLPGIRTIAQDHLGLFPKHHEMAVSSQVMILPETYILPEVVIRPRRTHVYPGLIHARRAGAGVEFFGVREYHTGDSRRSINHLISARHEQALFVNQFEQERAVDVGLILDCRVETNLFRGNRQILENGIQAAATLAETFLNYGNRVGLLIYGGGRNWVHPGYGKIQRERILRALAGVQLYEYIVSKELSNLPSRLFTARSQLVLISSLLYQDLPTVISLRANGYQLLVISPDPIDFESKLLGNSPAVAQAARIARLERDYMLRQIKRTGARLIDWQVDQPFYQLANKMLSRSAAWDRNRMFEHA